MTTSFHVSQLGSAAGEALRADMDGYIHRTPEAVLAGRWPGDYVLDRQWADEVAESNRRATEESERKLMDSAPMMRRIVQTLVERAEWSRDADGYVVPGLVLDAARFALRQPT